MGKNEANFAVRLVDRVTRPSRAIAAALGKVTRAAHRAAMVGKAGRFRDSSGRVREADGKFVRTKFGDGIKKANKGVTDLAKGLAGASAKGLALAGVMAGIGAGFVLKGIAEATIFAERMRMAFTSLTGSASAGEASFRRSIELARELGLGVQDTTKQYAKLLAAQFKAPQAERLIKLTTDLKAIGATAEETKSAIRAITQIKAKGRLQAEAPEQLPIGRSSSM